jgi:hypothetical protein
MARQFLPPQDTSGKRHGQKKKKPSAKVVKKKVSAAQAKAADFEDSKRDAKKFLAGQVRRRQAALVSGSNRKVTPKKSVTKKHEGRFLLTRQDRADVEIQIKADRKKRKPRAL